jgi:hypothetical protein
MLVLHHLVLRIVMVVRLADWNMMVFKIIANAVSGRYDAVHSRWTCVLVVDHSLQLLLKRRAPRVQMQRLSRHLVNIGSALSSYYIAWNQIILRHIECIDRLVLMSWLISALILILLVHQLLLLNISQNGLS